MVNITFEQINQAITEKGAKWKTKTLLESIDQDKKRGLGLRLDTALLETSKEKAAINIDTIITDFGREVKLLDKIDWRNYNGKNCITSIKYQKNCGSCVAFGTAATLESMLLIEHNKTYDLSEAELFYCGGANDASCAAGWWPANALPYLVEKGLSDEDCFPYIDRDVPCNTCPQRDTKAIKIEKHVEITNWEDRKKYLSSVGPLIAGMEVYTDFLNFYGEGIYSYVIGDFEGGHCIEIIGFDDTEKYWLCKNSWDNDWGENGFFKIAYGECKIDEFPAWGIAKTII
jgi:C1A family cysteine protease